MATSLVDNLRPVARDQVKLRDRILRATVTASEQTARGNSTALQWDMGAYASFMVTFAGDSSQFAIDGSNDLVAWFPIDVQPVSGTQNAPVGQLFYQENQATVGVVPTTNIIGNKQSRFVRVRTGTTSGGRNTLVTATLSQTPFTPTRPTKHLSPDSAWSYVAASGGITNNTPVAVKAAGNTYHRNIVTQAEFSNGGATATEVAILDGSTVMWRSWLGPNAVLSAAFDPPLRASAASAVNVSLSAASGAAVYANLRGLTALA